MAYQTCRFCKKVTTDGSFVRYATRCSACPRCFLERKGEAGLRELSLWQLERFPALIAPGLYELLGTIIREQREAAAAKQARHWNALRSDGGQDPHSQ